MRNLFTAIRFVVTAGLLTLLIRQVDMGRLADFCVHAGTVPLTAAVVALAAANPVVAWRWRAILAAEHVATGFLVLVKLVFVGSFFNQVLPTGIGGDAVRVWQCYRFGIPLGPAFRSVVIDRFAGYVLIVLLGPWSIAVMLQTAHGPTLFWPLTAVIAAAATAVAAAFLVDFLPRVITRFPVAVPVARLSRQIRIVFSAPGRSAAIVALSVAVTALPALSMKLIGDGVGAHISFGDWLAIWPPLILSQLLPISIAGWGVRETLLVILLAEFGVPAEAALGTSILIGASQIVVGLFGGLIWLTDNRQPGGAQLRISDINR